jgi:hypothetical protein
MGTLSKYGIAMVTKIRGGTSVVHHPVQRRQGHLLAHLLLAQVEVPLQRAIGTAASQRAPGVANVLVQAQGSRMQQIGTSYSKWAATFTEL